MNKDGDHTILVTEEMNLTNLNIDEDCDNAFMVTLSDKIRETKKKFKEITSELKKKSLDFCKKNIILSPKKDIYLQNIFTGVVQKQKQEKYTIYNFFEDGLLQINIIERTILINDDFRKMCESQIDDMNYYYTISEASVYFEAVISKEGEIYLNCVAKSIKFEKKL